MKRSRTWFAILSIFVGGFLFISFFTDHPVIKSVSAEIFLLAERLFAALLFLTVADTALLQVRKAGNDGGMRIIRIIGFGVFLAVLLLGLIKGSSASELNKIVFLIQQTMESALAGLVCICLIYAVYRLPIQVPTAMKTSFLVGMVVFLFIYGGFPRILGTSDTINNVIAWIECIPQGCIMGLLLGIALGGAIAGIRLILTGRLPAKEDK